MYGTHVGTVGAALETANNGYKLYRFSWTCRRLKKAAPAIAIQNDDNKGVYKAVTASTRFLRRLATIAALAIFPAPWNFMS